MYSAGRILLLPGTRQILQIHKTEYVNILGCQLPGILITTVSTIFCFSQHLLLLCTCSTFSKNAFTFPLMKHKTPSTATLGALSGFIHTQCVKQCLMHDLEKISTNRGVMSITYCTTNSHLLKYCLLPHFISATDFHMLTVHRNLFILKFY